MRKYAFVFAALCILAPQSLLAAGYGLREHSADAMGTAYAGSSATGSDASYLAYNPAAAGLVDNADYSLSLAGLFPTASASYSGTTAAFTPLSGPHNPSSFISNAAVPALAARWRLDDHWALGLGVTAPWGLMTEYPADWAGRYYGVDTKLLTINIQPVISYAITPHFIVAGGVQAQYAHGVFTNAIDVGTLAYGLHLGGTPGADDIGAHFSASGWGWGWTLGAIVQPTDAISLGVSYRSSVEINAKGHLDFKGVAGNPFAMGIGIFTDGPAQTSLTTPDMLNLGARIRVCEDWSLLGEADWTNWSVFKDLRIVPASPYLPDDVTITNWKDSWFLSLGAEYRASDRWILHAGTALDGSPVTDATRGPRIPDGDRVWLSAGARYHASEAIDLAFSAAHLFLDQQSVDLSGAVPANALRGYLSGKTNASVNVFALQLIYRPQ
jgi:long-chain fatty acid transport protein